MTNLIIINFYLIIMETCYLFLIPKEILRFGIFNLKTNKLIYLNLINTNNKLINLIMINPNNKHKVFFLFAHKNNNKI
jgi:hypothetical protein